MKVLQLNTHYPEGSTGRISQGIHDTCLSEGIACKTAYRFPEEGLPADTMAASSWLDCHVHNRLSWITGLQGFFSAAHTRDFLHRVKAYDPDLIQLHNIQGSYLNWPLLFDYLKKAGKPVVWTLHDCISFTGRCPFFIHSGCSKWKTGCGSCPSIHDFPSAWMDATHFCYEKKRRWFTGVPRLKLVTPSRWLASLLPDSYLKDYPVQVIPNGIDLSVFKPEKSDFREKHGIGKRKLLLFVANVWEARKGPGTILRFASLPKEDYAVCVVGTDEALEHKLPKEVIAIRRTQNAKELAQLYTAADLFVNPTLEDNYPTVNMEALACGTPVLTYGSGGSGEIPSELCGCVIPRGNEDALMKAALAILRSQPFSREACLERAKEFDQKKRFRQYTELYRELCKK